MVMPGTPVIATPSPVVPSPVPLSSVAPSPETTTVLVPVDPPGAEPEPCCQEIIHSIISEDASGRSRFRRMLIEMSAQPGVDAGIYVSPLFSDGGRLFLDLHVENEIVLTFQLRDKEPVNITLTPAHLYYVDASRVFVYVRLMSLLRDWVSQPYQPYEHRNQAANNIIETLLYERDYLVISGLNLTTLPEKAIPDHIKFIDMRNNLLTEWPELPDGIMEINAESNRFPEFPENVPDSVTLLSLRDNCIEVLPFVWPKNLQKVDLGYNKLRLIIPPIPSHISVNTRGNPLQKLLKGIQGYSPCALSDKFELLTHWPSAGDVTLWVDFENTTNEYLNLSHNYRVTTESMADTKEKSEMREVWQKWAIEPVGVHEHRRDAFCRMLECMHKSLPYLNLSQLGLTTLPARLPEQILLLDVAHNELRELPPLSDNIRVIIANDNQLARITRIPCTLAALIVKDNMLTSLANLDWPRYLKFLDVSNNGIAAIPTGVPMSTRVNLDGNPLIRPTTLVPYFGAFHFSNGGVALIHWPARHIVTLWLDRTTGSEDRITLTRNYAISPAVASESEEYCRLRLEWQAWANQPTGSIENRGEALKRMTEGLSLKFPFLNLAGLGLSTLPQHLPPHLILLDIAGNKLTTLPALPEKLKALIASHNLLQTITGLPETLMLLNLSDNLLTELKVLKALPRKLVYLNLRHNPMTTYIANPGERAPQEYEQWVEFAETEDWLTDPEINVRE